MSIHNLIEYSDNYVKIFGNFLHYDTDQPADNTRNSNSLKSKKKSEFLDNNKNADTITSKIAVPMKYISENF